VARLPRRCMWRVKGYLPCRQVWCGKSGHPVQIKFSKVNFINNFKKIKIKKIRSFGPLIDPTRQ
jgi:hypothetical protein